MIQIKNLSHFYGKREALKKISLEVGQGELVAFLGPNGSGKTTLFSVLSTLLKPTSCEALSINKIDLFKNPLQAREKMGVVFQSPSLDGKLTVCENLTHQGHLYGLSGRVLQLRMDECLLKVKLTDRKNEIVEKLSGGLKRRAEIAKALLHNPTVLLLDEPTTGLDPGVRADIWSLLLKLKKEDNVTCLVTTHLMGEAEQCDRVAIFDVGRLLVFDSPQKLKKEVGGDMIVLSSSDLNGLKTSIDREFGLTCEILSNTLRLEKENGAEFLPKVIKAFHPLIDSATLSKPTLEDVFIKRTGHPLAQERRS